MIPLPTWPILGTHDRKTRFNAEVSARTKVKVAWRLTLAMPLGQMQKPLTSRKSECRAWVGSVLGYSEQFVNSGHIHYTNSYQIDRRNGPDSITFEMRIGNSKQLTNIIRTNIDGIDDFSSNRPDAEASDQEEVRVPRLGRVSGLGIAHSI